VLMSVSEIEYVFYALAESLGFDSPDYEISKELKEEGIRGEYCDSVVYTTEPENSLLAIHEFCHYVYDMENEGEQEDDMHGSGYEKVCEVVSGLMEKHFDIRFSISEIVEVPFGEVYIG